MQPSHVEKTPPKTISGVQYAYKTEGPGPIRGSSKSRHASVTLDTLERRKVGKAARRDLVATGVELRDNTRTAHRAPEASQPSRICPVCEADGHAPHARHCHQCGGALDV